jgi:hypothetical protein
LSECHRAPGRVHVTSNRQEVDITPALLANTSSHPAAAMAFAIMVNVAFVGRVDLDGASRLAVGADSPDGLKKRTAMWAQITVAP